MSITPKPTIAATDKQALIQLREAITQYLSYLDADDPQAQEWFDYFLAPLLPNYAQESSP